MNMNEYQELANRTLKQDTDMDKIIHAGMGMVTEAGEFIDPIKKHIFYGQDLDRLNLIEELGDVLWYVAAACNGLGITLDYVANANIRKLARRYPDGFSAFQALNRDISAELKELSE